VNVAKVVSLALIVLLRAIANLVNSAVTFTTVPFEKLAPLKANIANDDRVKLFTCNLMSTSLAPELKNKALLANRILRN